jgi:hypothetical protein
VSENNEWSEGRLVNLAKSVPSNPTDCSGWESDIPAERWSHGSLVNLAKPVASNVTDCSDWDRRPAVWLELVASSEVRGLPAGAVMKHTFALVNAISKTVPALGLSYDMREEGESQVVTLRTKAVGLDAAELAKLAEAVRKEVEAAGWKVRNAG